MSIMHFVRVGVMCIIVFYVSIYIQVHSNNALPLVWAEPHRHTASVSKYIVQRSYDFSQKILSSSVSVYMNGELGLMVYSDRFLWWCARWSESVRW